MTAEIPEDVMRAADAAWNEKDGLSTLGREDETMVIARAILAERERCAQVAEAGGSVFRSQIVCDQIAADIRGVKWAP